MILQIPYESLRHDSLVVACCGYGRAQIHHIVHHCPLSPGDTLAQLIVDIAPSAFAAMDSATAASVYGMRFPVTARSRDDPRLLGWRMVDGKSQALQQRHLAELEAEGRKMKDQPKEDTPGSGMLAAIAHFDALQAAKKPVIKAEAESGFEKDLVGISHDWVSKWPSTSTIWIHMPGVSSSSKQKNPTTRKRC